MLRSGVQGYRLIPGFKNKQQFGVGSESIVGVGGFLGLDYNLFVDILNYLKNKLRLDC